MKPLLIFLFLISGRMEGQDIAKVSIDTIIPAFWHPKYIYFGKEMCISVDSGTIYFFKDVDSIANAFAHFVAEHYSAYCDSLRSENADQMVRIHRLQKAIHKINLFLIPPPRYRMRKPMSR